MTPPTNGEIANVFAEIADLLEIQGGDKFRIRAFRNASRVVETLPEPAHQMLRFGKLEKTPGVGEGTVHRIKQILRSGTTDDHVRLKSQLPTGMRDMLDVKGIGPRTARTLWVHLRIGSVDELELAARSGRLSKLPRFGHDRIDSILRGIGAWRKRVGRLPLSTSLKAAGAIRDALRELPEVLRAEIAGSARRRKETIGDLDILVAADDGGPVVQRFVSLPSVAEVLVAGEGRASVRLKTRQQCDVRILPLHSFGAGMHYFTGSKMHNIAIRARGKRMGIKISDHGAFELPSERLINPCQTEEEVFAAVGLPFIPPELRENVGEIEAAARGELPVLVELDDLRGDLHMHTTASDGRGSLRDMVDAAREIGHQYIAITEHSQTTSIANGLDEKRLLAQIDAIRKLDLELPDIRVLAGIEVDILPDGSLDFDAGILSKLDWVVASVHSDFHFPVREMTERVIRAMKTGMVDCIGHPTGRKLGTREGYKLDMDAILKEARRLDVALEVNGNPRRMDLDGVLCRQCREYGVPVVINTDAHAPWHMAVREYGLWPARRGWLEKRHVLNTFSWEVIEERRRSRLQKHGISARARTRIVEPEPSTTPESSDSSPRPDDSLVLALGKRPLDPDVRARVERFMTGGGDEPLERALATLGPNALQAAFNLIAGA